MAFNSFGLRARCSTALVAVPVACAFVGFAGPVVARIGPCKGSVEGADESHLLDAARRVFPPDTEAVVTNACHMGRGLSAEVATRKVPDSPNSTHWWVTHCGREDGDWTCIRRGMMRETEQRLIVDGIPRRVAITLEGDTPIEAPKSLVIRAIHLFTDPDSQPPFCGRINAPPSRWRSLQKEHPLPDRDTVIPVTVAPQVTRGLVLFDNVIQPDEIKIEIQLPSDAATPADAYLPCYAAMGQ